MPAFKDSMGIPDYFLKKSREKKKDSGKSLELATSLALISLIYGNNRWLIFKESGTLF